jgi:hypothetical protein
MGEAVESMVPGALGCDHDRAQPARFAWVAFAWRGVSLEVEATVRRRN